MNSEHYEKYKELYKNMTKLNRQNNVSDTAIRNAINNGRRSAGYKWNYKNGTIMV